MGIDKTILILYSFENMPTDFFSPSILGRWQGEYWVRPLSMWEELVEVNGEKVPRFRYIGE